MEPKTGFISSIKFALFRHPISEFEIEALLPIGLIKNP
jgi:hypothetical protein